jgi:N-acetylglucosaminyldiphosphoundecaprenol N-acetyl-beta-D-mannosaminyltransferase
MTSVDILGTPIERTTAELLQKEMVGYLRGQRPWTIAKVNPEFLVRSLADAEFQACLSSFDVKIADGVGVVWAARFLTLETVRTRWIARAQIVWQAAYSLASLLLHPRFCQYPLPERLPGVEALYLMLEAAQEAGASVYFLGASGPVNVRARERIQAKYPNLQIAGGRDGYWQEENGVIEEINASEAALLIVALGSPKQEHWIHDHLPHLSSVRVAVGEGGSLEFIAGEFRRAPYWMRRTSLEWFWRLFMNRSKTRTGSRPRRVWNAVAVFVHRVVAWKLQHGATRLEEGPVS